VTVDTMTTGWLTLAQAAEQLGISVHAVRRRVKAGELVGHQVPTKHGAAWMVRLDGDRQGDATVPPGLREGDVTPAPASRNGHATVTEVPGVVELVELIQELQAKLDDAHAVIVARTEVAATWQERAGMLADRLALAESKLAALEAPTEPAPSESPIAPNLTAESPDPSPEPPIEPDPFPAPLPPTSNAAPWWRRWLGAVYGW
jgi:hypothetical protein